MATFRVETIVEKSSGAKGIGFLFVSIICKGAGCLSGFFVFLNRAFPSPFDIVLFFLHCLFPEFHTVNHLINLFSRLTFNDRIF